jgi:deoxyribose-phosphate aldolase
MKTEIAKFIDHTCLKPDASETEIRQLVEEAKEFGFNSICIRPEWLEKFSASYKSSAVIDFPKSIIEINNRHYEEGASATDEAIQPDLDMAKKIIGNSSLEDKGAEAKQALDLGAKELDPVIGIYRLASIETELRAYLELMEEKGEELWLKPIFSCELLSWQEINFTIETFIREVSRHLHFYPESKLKFAYKNSTGFIRHCEDPERSEGDVAIQSLNFTSLELISFIAKNLDINDPHRIINIKAAGGIRDIETARKIISAAQGRLSHIGTSAGLKICEI